MPGRIYHPGELFRLSSGYGPRDTGIPNASTIHRGVDFSAKEGTPIPAAMNGVVYFSGVLGTYGNVVVLQHKDDTHGTYYTLYAHMMQASSLRPGEAVALGQLIGFVGNTGIGSAPHLHFEIIRNQANPLKKGHETFDPSKFEFPIADSAVVSSSQEPFSYLDYGYRLAALLGDLPIANGKIHSIDIKIGGDVNRAELASRLSDLDATYEQDASAKEGFLELWNEFLGRTQGAQASRLEVTVKRSAPMSTEVVVTTIHRPDFSLEKRIERLNFSDGLHQEYEYNQDNVQVRFQYSWKIDNWNGKPVVVLADTDLKTGLYTHSVFDSPNLNSAPIWRAVTWRDEKNHFVRREIDEKLSSYHDIIHESASETSSVILDAFGWKDSLGRAVRREVERSSNLYRDFVFSDGDETSNIIWKVLTWRDGTGRFVRREEDTVESRFHEYIHATFEESSPLIAEVWSMRDTFGRHVRHELDRQKETYHDYVSESPLANTRIIAEAWTEIDGSGRLVRHELDKNTLASHDYYYAGTSNSSAIIKEVWKEVGNRGLDSYEKTIAGDKVRLTFTLADGDTGWAEKRQGRLVAFEKTKDWTVWGKVGVTPNPGYVPSTWGTGLFPSIIDVEGSINGSLRQWYYDSANFGWSYNSTYGVRFRYFDKGVLYTEEIFNNPFASTKSTVLKSPSFDYFGMPGPGSFDQSLFDEAHLVGLPQGNLLIA